MKLLDYIKRLFKNNKPLSIILSFILLFFIFFIIHYNNCTVTMDEIWNYGFAYNISQGLIPYRDFNIILTPLYSFLLAILIYIFGHHFILMIILNAILSSIVQYLLIKKYGLKTLLLFPCLVFSNYGCYNFLSLLLFLVFLNIKDGKKNEIWKGLLAILMILTKQTVGGVIFLFSFFTSKNKKEYLMGFLPLCLIFLGYLLFNGALYQFLDYCFFGMFEFTGGNSLSNTDIKILFYLVLIVILIKKNIENKFKDRDLLYILLFQVMSLPIFDFFHILISVIPFLAYLLFNQKKKTIEGYTALVTIFFYVSFTLFIDVFNPILYTSRIYSYNNSFLNGKRLNIDLVSTHDIMRTISEDYPQYRTYHLYTYAYLDKLEYGKTLNKYDLINKGNMGYLGENKYIEEIKEDCSHQKCLFIIESIKKGDQISDKIINYIKDNYKFSKHMYYVDFYIN